MTWGAQAWLWALVPLLLLAVLDAFGKSRHLAIRPKIARLEVGTKAPKPVPERSRRSRLTLWLGLACVVTALARPQWGLVEDPAFEQAREVVIAMDLSRSMLADDVKPSRLERARLLVHGLLDGLSGERVGLLLFAGTAYLQSPLSPDYQVLREFLPELSPDFLPQGGTNFDELFSVACDSFTASAGADRFLVLLSDGGDPGEEDLWRKHRTELRERGIRVIALGIGTATGAPVPARDGGFTKDGRGAVILSRLNAATLAEIARGTGGAYQDASAWVDLPALLDRTVNAGRAGEFMEKRMPRLQERFQWVLAPGLLLLLLGYLRHFPSRPHVRDLRAALGRTPPAHATARTMSTPTHAPFVLALACLLAAGLPGGRAQQVSSQPTAPQPPPEPALLGTVRELSVKSPLDARDFERIANDTLAYCEPLHASGNRIAGGLVRDGLDAVAGGRNADPAAADWNDLQQRLEKLLQPPPEQQKQDQKQQQQEQKQDQQQQQEQQQNQEQKDQNQQQQQGGGEQQQEQKQDQKQQETDQTPGRPEQQQQENQNRPPPPQTRDGEKNDSARKGVKAFGDMERESPPARPQNQEPMQEVGGTTGEQAKEIQENPELALPLQQLDRVKDQDSPAKLFQLLRGKPPPEENPGQDW